MPYNGLKHTYNHVNFKVCLGNKYSSIQQLPFGVPQGWCSGANIFTCYSPLIDKIVLEDIIVNRFADDHSLRKSFPPSDLKKQKSTQRKLEHTLAVIKS